MHLFIYLRVDMVKILSLEGEIQPILYVQHIHHGLVFWGGWTLFSSNILIVDFTRRTCCRSSALRSMDGG